MQKNVRYLLFCLLICPCAILMAQTKSAGPVIPEFGEVFKIDNPEFKVDTTIVYKAVFDITASPESHESINKSIETAARFLNMHAQVGVPVEQLKVALVVHNKASKDLIDNGAYQKRYGTDNPNEKLIKALLDANVDVIFCGQSSVARKFPKEELIDGVQISLSAMNALIQLQNKDYRLIKF